VKLGLDVEKALLARLDNPERAFASIHVAGTNGKGSVCAIIESVLRTAGLKVALYTSPHLVTFNERIRVDGEAIADADLAAVIKAAEKASDVVAVETGHQPTFFECATAMAFAHFRNSDARVAVLETGMGGRLDATNVVQPVVSAITRIGLEHAAYLGNDIETIAAEKLGIVKKGAPVVCGANDEAVLCLARSTARERGAPFIDAASCSSVELLSCDFWGQKVRVETANASYGTLEYPLAGRHQLENLATAITCIETFAELCGIEIEPGTVSDGASRVRWPGRFQLVREEPPLVVDVAHNPDAAAALGAAFRSIAGKRKLGLIVGMCSDKDVRGFLKAFSGQAKRLWAVPIENDRSMSPDTIVSAGRNLGCEASQSMLAKALDESAEWAAGNEGIVCVTGSLFLAGEALQLFEPPEEAPGQVP